MKKMQCQFAKKACTLRRKRITRLSRVSNVNGVRCLNKYNWTEHCGSGKVLECVVYVYERSGKKKVSRAYRRKMRKEAYLQSHNIRKGGKVIECRMSKEDRRLHEKSQKAIFCHTKRSLNIVVNKVKYVGTINGGKSTEVVLVKSENLMPDERIGVYATCETKRKCINSDPQIEVIQCDLTNVHENECWICDNMIGPLEAKVQCDCSAWYHVNCMGLQNEQSDNGSNLRSSCNRHRMNVKHLSDTKLSSTMKNEVIIIQTRGYYLRNKKTKKTAAYKSNTKENPEGIHVGNAMSEEITCSNGVKQHPQKTFKMKKRPLSPCEELNEKNVKKCAKLNEIKGLVVHGHFHQGHLKFGVNTGNSVYVANSLCAMMYSHIKELRQWMSHDMDLILNTGDELYGHLSKSSTMNNNYLLINELPNELIVLNNSYTMTYHESVTGMFEEDGNLAEFNMMQLNRALEQTLQIYNACFICFNGNTFAVIAQDGLYYVCDSHSRDDNGWQVQDGMSILKLTPTWQDVYRYCTELRTSMNLHNNEQFEITGVTLCQDDDATVCLCTGEQVEEEVHLNMCDMTTEVLSELPDKEGNDIVAV